MSLPTSRPSRSCTARRAPARAGLAAALALLLAPAAGAQDDPLAFIEFPTDFTSNCVIRNGVQLQIRSTHPSRAIKVTLERTLAGRPTGDRSRSLLQPGAEPEPLGCSVASEQPQAWRVLQAGFVD